ncbi:MAG: helix-turn-helix domain-containing protein [Chloroflexota bacterium]
MTASRQRILSHLRRLGPASAMEIARALSTTPANARHHLSVLASDGRVTVVRERRAGRGRPVKVYGLSAALQGDNLAGLLNSVLGEWLGNLPEKKKEERLRELAKALGGEMSPANLPLARRLAVVVERLNEKYYAARWEAGAEGPRVIFGHCPYAAIIEKHPELCQIDAFLLEGQVGLGARQTAKIEKGQGMCIFAMR